MTAQEIVVQPEAQLTESRTADIMMNPELLQQMEGMAQRMATAKVTVPGHLKGCEGDCYAIVMQAVQWGMNPYAVAQKTHLVHGTLGYEAQLVNAVINSQAPTQDRIHYEWFGPWEKILGKFKTKKGQKGDYQAPDWDKADEEGLGVRCWATMKGEESPRELELLLVQATVRNSTLWAADPRQQLAYLAVKRWARLYCPDVILGVYTPDELQDSRPPEKEIGPGTATSDLNETLKGAKPAEDAEIIDAEVVDTKEEPETMTYAGVADAINKANTPPELQAAVALMADFVGLDGCEKYKEELGKLYRDRLAQLKGSTDQEST